ncbi:DUF1617 family protein [Liquorilactobacillus mali]|uniref:DUF1617 family protein n=1 Tax=Liquorilactobacillus mali KCTC 3596 = DSM 20444 TaxID=1046596 RepID=J1F4Z8_9LACO|nr:DUF1617 family protein [Liquorilactobacillus mali]EJF01098.1 hypothetical protein LMA_01879 [Liquorilactobacillus mali KCTC 3596 = DSM 20444]KRN07322.1 hypothetical protein FD00_GL000210 [Liquorilactobacillus mali KCTC 3596 = DSM 20444]QFQ74973.1 DUF1617 family protein [Liquorilactobacillus mali]
MSKLIEFENGELVAIGNFLAQAKLKGKASRGRTKLIKLIEDKNKEYNEERDTVRDPYFQVDEKGEKIVKDNKYVLKDTSKGKELDKELADLAEETVGIEFTEYNEKIKALYDALDNYNYELSNADAVIYDLLLDKLEENYEKEGK